MFYYLQFIQYNFIINFKKALSIILFIHLYNYNMLLYVLCWKFHKHLSGPKVTLGQNPIDFSKFGGEAPFLSPFSYPNINNNNLIRVLPPFYWRRQKLHFAYRMSQPRHNRDQNINCVLAVSLKLNKLPIYTIKCSTNT